MAHFFAEQGYHLLRHHWLTFWAEVDLVMAHPQKKEMVILEVKSRWSGRPLSVQQMRRLQRVFLAVRARVPEAWDVCIRVALVGRNKSVELFEFSDLCR